MNIYRNNNKPISYELKDYYGNVTLLNPDDLKNKIKCGKISVDNLTLSKDNRIIPHKTLGNNTQSNRKVVMVDRATFDAWWKALLKKIQQELGGKLKVEDKSFYKGEYHSLFYYIEGIPFHKYTYSIWFIIKSRLAIATSKEFIEVELMVLDDDCGDEDGYIKYCRRELQKPLFTKNNMKSIEKAIASLLKSHNESLAKYYRNIEKQFNGR